MVALEVDTTPFTAARADGKVLLDLMLLGASRDRGEVFPIRERIEATLRGTGSRGEWWTLTREMRLPAGVSQLRALVRDVATGRAGTVAQRFEVPPVDGFRLSTPILSDRVEASSAAGGRQAPVLVAHRAFRPEGRLYCQYEVFGAQPLRDQSSPVMASYSLRRSDGSLVREAPPTPIVPGANGRLVRMLGLSLDGLPEGRYELQIRVENGPGGHERSRPESRSSWRAAAAIGGDRSAPGRMEGRRSRLALQLLRERLARHDAHPMPDQTREMARVVRDHRFRPASTSDLGDVGIVSPTARDPIVHRGAQQPHASVRAQLGHFEATGVLGLEKREGVDGSKGGTPQVGVWPPRRTPGSSARRSGGAVADRRPRQS